MGLNSEASAPSGDDRLDTDGHGTADERWMEALEEATQELDGELDGPVDEPPQPRPECEQPEEAAGEQVPPGWQLRASGRP